MAFFVASFTQLFVSSPCLMQLISKSLSLKHLTSLHKTKFTLKNTDGKLLACEGHKYHMVRSILHKGLASRPQNLCFFTKTNSSMNW